jgi:hypothetical protein
MAAIHATFWHSGAFWVTFWRRVGPTDFPMHEYCFPFQARMISQKRMVARRRLWNRRCGRHLQDSSVVLAWVSSFSSSRLDDDLSWMVRGSCLRHCHALSCSDDATRFLYSSRVCASMHVCVDVCLLASLCDKNRNRTKNNGRRPRAHSGSMFVCIVPMNFDHRIPFDILRSTTC